MGLIIVFIAGAVIGSFLNVCIYRLPKGKSIVFPPSHCTSCNKAITWYDNIPVLSCILLGGRCRRCKAKISSRYLAVEVLTAALMTLIFLKFGLNAKFFAYAAMSCGLIIATFVDFEIQEIPDEISIGGAVAGLVAAAAFPALFDTGSRFQALGASFLGAAAGAGSIYAIGLVGKAMFRKKIEALGLERAMGFGDVKLMAMIGSFLGWKLVLLTFFIAPFLGAVIGIILKIKEGRDVMPYGPYLSLAAVAAVFFGENILRMMFCQI